MYHVYVDMMMCVCACVHVSQHSAGAWRSWAWCMMIALAAFLIDAVSLSLNESVNCNVCMTIIWSTIVHSIRCKSKVHFDTIVPNQLL